MDRAAHTLCRRLSVSLIDDAYALKLYVAHQNKAHLSEGIESYWKQSSQLSLDVMVRAPRLT